MRIISIALAFLFLVALFCKPSLALAEEQSTGNTYLAECDNIHGAPKDQCIALLAGYLIGFYTSKAIFLDVTHEVAMAEATLRKTNPPPCIPNGITSNQIYDILINYLHTHPENRQNNIAALIWIALSQAWPCTTPIPTDIANSKEALHKFLGDMNLQPKAFCIGSLCLYWKAAAHVPTTP